MHRGLSLPAHILAAELLVRGLREQEVDARHISIEDLDTPRPPGANPLSVAIVYISILFSVSGRARIESRSAVWNIASSGRLWATRWIVDE